MHICQDVDSLRPLFPGDEIIKSCGTVIEQTAEDLKRVHAHYDNVPAIEVADAYYMKASMVESVNSLENAALISKMRKDAVAYKNPKPKKPGTRGPQARLGESVKLAALCLKRLEVYLQICLLAQEITQLTAQRLADLGVSEREIIYKRTYSEKTVSSWVAQQLLSEIFFSSRHVRGKVESKSLITEIFKAVEHFSGMQKDV